VRELPLQPDIDVLALAGDIVGGSQTALQMRKVLAYFCAHAPEVIYVTGNHEYYHSDLTETHARIMDATHDLSNFHWLRTGAPYQLGDYLFIGDTMWFDYLRDPLNEYHSKIWSDFHQIKHLATWVGEHNVAFTKYLREALSIGLTGKPIIMTHHLPAPGSLNTKFARENTDRWFLCDQREIMAEYKPALWIHGHTHSDLDYMFEETRIVCHPTGYIDMGQNHNWRTDFKLVEV
jgi:predicted phosphodiesterase